MQTIKLIGFLLLSISIQIILVPFRAVVVFLKIVGKVISILEETFKHLINTTVNEVLKNNTNHGKRERRKEKEI